MNNLIELRGIRHSFPEAEWELDLQELSLAAGEILGIIGPNGSGKTTLLRIASGILRPRLGTTLLCQQDLLQMDRKAVARHLGYLPQELSSEYDFAVEDLVRMGRYSHASSWGRLGPEDLQAIQASLEATGMKDLSQRRLSRLSGGEKKRAYLASVLAQKPQLLLLDEPTAALDLHHQVRFFRLLQDLAQKEMGIAVVSHNINLAALFSHRLLLLKGGRCLAMGRPEEVLTEQNVRDIYGDDILMQRHPETGSPTLLAHVKEENRK
jgi:iron complex transport system ATP-binding protein